METIIYRHGAGSVTPEIGNREAPAGQPDMFYPVMSRTKLDTWAHWLPTSLVFTRSGDRIPWIDKTLMRLQAPPEVVEEYRWSVALELFDAYEIRTPECRDLRDPLFIGRCGSQRYRVALWGESLRPFEEITALVQEASGIAGAPHGGGGWSLAVGSCWGSPSDWGSAVGRRMRAVSSEPACWLP